MHETVIYEKIFMSLLEMCSINLMNKVNRIVVGVGQNSHVNKESLEEYLVKRNSKIFHNTEVNIEIEKIDDQEAVIKKIEGEYE